MSMVGKWLRRATARLATVLLASTVALAGASFEVAAADGVCAAPTRLFAQRAVDGRLMEIPRCASPNRLGAERLVGHDDWRRHRLVSAVATGDSVVFYAISTAGELWGYRQAGPGASLSGPIRLAADIDWSTSMSLIVPEPGFLHTQDGATVRTWAHPEWAVGGAELIPLDPLLTDVEGPALNVVRWGRFGEGVYGRKHFRVWRSAGYPTSEAHPDVWYVSGRLPADVTGVDGGEPDLYGLDSSGAVVWLRQDLWLNTTERCPLIDARVWGPAARSPGRGFVRVVVPARPMASGSPGLAETPTMAACQGPLDQIKPYEWH